MSILILILLMAVQTDVVNCTITAEKTVKCEGIKGQWSLVGADEESLDEWRWRPQYHEDRYDVNRPLVKVALSAGMKVKATIDSNGNLTPVASCDTRVVRRVQAWTGLHPGERYSFTLEERPPDCQSRVTQ